MRESFQAEKGERHLQAPDDEGGDFPPDDRYWRRMTWELVAYLALLSVTLLVAKLRGGSAKLLIVAAVIIYVLAVRLSPWDADINNYARTMHAPWQARFINPFYLKEWAYWGTSAWLYGKGWSELAVFLFFDAIALFAITRIKAPPYFIGLAFVMFPSVLGVQNVHRQFVATCLLLWAIQMVQKRRWLVFMAAVLCHNAAALFGPLMLKSRKLMVLGGIMVLVLLPYVTGTKSSNDTGANLTLAYAMLTLIIPMAAILIRRGVIAKDIFYPLAYNAAITFAAVATLAPSQAERVGMIALFTALPHILYYVENHVTERWTGRALLILALSLPTLLAPASMRFLLSQ